MLLCKQGLCRSFYSIRIHSPLRLWGSLKLECGYTFCKHLGKKKKKKKVKKAAVAVQGERKKSKQNNTDL